MNIPNKLEEYLSLAGLTSLVGYLRVYQRAYHRKKHMKGPPLECLTYEHPSLFETFIKYDCNFFIKLAPEPNAML